MSNTLPSSNRCDVAPGDLQGSGAVMGEIATYGIGMALASLLTVISFALPHSNLVWVPSIPIALSVLAVAQMGVHLVFFLHMTSGTDNANNLTALAFGLLIVMLLVFGSMWIMQHLNHAASPMQRMVRIKHQDLAAWQTNIVGIHSVNIILPPSTT